MFGMSLALLPVLMVLVVAVFFFSGVRVVRPTSRGLVERLGKYHRLASPGFNWIIPGVDRMLVVNVTEVMVNA
jgi:regulator of protease activity HflC (stomatin/prohibitin superfamily)